MQPGNLHSLDDEYSQRFLRRRMSCCSADIPGSKPGSAVVAAAGAVNTRRTRSFEFPLRLSGTPWKACHGEFYLYTITRATPLYIMAETPFASTRTTGIAMLNPEALGMTTKPLPSDPIAQGSQAAFIMRRPIHCRYLSRGAQGHQSSYRLAPCFAVFEPIVTGAFSNKTVRGSDRYACALCRQPRAARADRINTDVCPAPPLIWSNFRGRTVDRTRRARHPSRVVSGPLSNAATAVTMLGTITQHTAECLAGHHHPSTGARKVPPLSGAARPPSSTCARCDPNGCWKPPCWIALMLGSPSPLNMPTHLSLVPPTQRLCRCTRRASKAASTANPAR